MCVLRSFLAAGCACRACSAAAAGRHAAGLPVQRADLYHYMDDCISPRVQKIPI